MVVQERIVMALLEVVVIVKKVRGVAEEDVQIAWTK